MSGGVQKSGSENTFDTKRLEDRLNDAQKYGIIQSIGNVTPTLNAASTTVTHYGCSSTSWVMLMPLDATTAAEYALGTTYVTPAKGSFVVTHPNNATARSYRYVWFSGIRL